MSSNNSFSTENQMNFTTVAENQMVNQSSLRFTLKHLNDIQARIYYGADILFASLMIPGIIGNLHVLHIYIYKKPKNNTRVYVLFLAMIDLMSCTLVYPFNIANCLLPYMFYDNVSCKIFLFLNAFATLGSAVALLVIAIERYRKICTPFKTQITIRYAKLSCVLVVVITGICSIPLLFLFGSTRIQTFEPEYYGYECHYVTELRNSLFQFLYSGGILFVTACMSISMIILYSLIGLHLWRQNKKMNRNNATKKQDKVSQAVVRDTIYQVNRSQTDSSTTDTTTISTELNIGEPSVSNKQDDECNKVKTHSLPEEASENNHHEIAIIYEDEAVVKIELDNKKIESKLKSTTGMDPDVRNMKSSNQLIGYNSEPIYIMDVEQSKQESANQIEEEKKGKKLSTSLDTDNKSDKTKREVKMRKLNKADQMKRTSYMFFLITLCFLISYISHPFLRLYQVLNMDWYTSLNLPSLITFHTALVTLYINNAANSFIYTVCDGHYRQEIKAFYAKLFCCGNQG